MSSFINNRKQFVRGRNLKKLARLRTRLTLTCDYEFLTIGVANVAEVVKHFEKAKEAGFIMPPP